MSAKDDFDSPWKEILESYFPDFMAFFFPEVHAAIDWSRSPIFLDKELQSITRVAKQKRRFVDKLIQVWRTDGTDLWVLIHVEIQGQLDPLFAERMFVYHYRIFDSQHRPIMSLAILTDTNAYWKPTTYQHTLWGCQLNFTFPVIKLRDYTDKQAMLQSSTNPFAMVVLAQLTAHATRKDMIERARSKYALTRRLYQQGLSRQAITDLYRFIDWILHLPDDLDALVWQQIKEYEEQQHMTYVTTAERIGRREGLQQGKVDGQFEAARTILKRLAEKRFGSLPEAISSRIMVLSLAQLEELTLALLDFQSYTDMEAWLESL